MDVQDIAVDGKNISRLSQAKSLIEAYTLAHPENRYGLAIFAGQARLVSPLTTEASSILTFLASTDTTSISVGGTNFAEAINTALDRFETPLLTNGRGVDGGTS